jgi:hypothetical protein
MHKKTVILIVVFGIVATLLLAVRFFGFPISDRELLREATQEFKKANSATGPYVYWDLFCQQAAQAYYDDARATILLSHSDTDMQYALVTLARIRAKNGDVEGALRTARAYSASETRAKAIQEIATVQAERDDVRGARETAATVGTSSGALEAIAIVQAQKGDLRGARETVVPIGHSDRVLGAVAGYQIQVGDFDCALKTAQEIYPANIANLLLDLADALRDRRELSRAHELASHVTNSKVAHLFLEYVRLRQWDLENIPTLKPNICEQGYFLIEKHEFAAAYALIEKTRCWYSFLAIKQYANDPAGAEQALQRSADPMDVCFGLTEFAKAAATNGNIRDALRFIDAAQKGCGEKGGDVFGAVRQVAREWTIREKPKIVVKWARSRPSPPQRELALLGVAEAMGHPHP